MNLDTPFRLDNFLQITVYLQKLITLLLLYST